MRVGRAEIGRTADEWIDRPHLRVHRYEPSRIIFRPSCCTKLASCYRRAMRQTLMIGRASRIREFQRPSMQTQFRLLVVA